MKYEAGQKKQFKQFRDVVQRFIDNPSRDNFLRFVRTSGFSPRECPLFQKLLQYSEFPDCRLDDIRCPMGADAHFCQFYCTVSALDNTTISALVVKAIELQAFMEMMKK